MSFICGQFGLQKLCFHQFVVPYLCLDSVRDGYACFVNILTWEMFTFVIILDVIKYCDHPRWYKKISPGGGTSNWTCHLQLEVGLEVSPPIRGGTSNWRWLMHVGPHRGTHVTCRNQLFFWKKRDYLLLITSSSHLSTRWNVNLLNLLALGQNESLPCSWFPG